jgi:[ribosomal protein S5]-alanine N-acetyltransferase
MRSERLIFLPWTDSDFDDAIRLWSDPDVMEFVDPGRVGNPDAVKSRLMREIQCLGKYGVQYWRIVEADTNEFVGSSGLRPWLWDDAEPDGYELGFHLLKEKWGKGFATEAATRCIRLAFDELKIPKLLAGHHPMNTPSKAVLTKLGFHHVRDCFYEPTGLHHPVYALFP